MSEYQYYEFLAIDRPVSQADQKWLRSLSTRAEISSTRFVNTYEWGNFKGDPVKLMKRCSDAFVYVSNFGVYQFMLKIPADASLLTQAQDYCRGEGLQLIKDEAGFLLDFTRSDDPEDTFEDDGSSWMAALTPLRNDLMYGDFRALYLAWLRNVQCETFKEGDVEPPVPAGLKMLSAPLEALSEFLQMDPSLIRIVAKASSAEVHSATDQKEHNAWIETLPAAAKDRMLGRVMAGDGVAVRGELTREFNKQSVKRSPPSHAQGRSAQQLFDEWHAVVARQGA